MFFFFTRHRLSNMPSVQCHIFHAKGLLVWDQCGLEPLLTLKWRLKRRGSEQLLMLSSSPSSAFSPELLTLVSFFSPSPHLSSSLFHYNFFFGALQLPLHSPSPLPPFFTHRWNSVLSAACIMATMVFVTEVPMLDPMMIGTADLTSSTGETTRNNTIYLKVIVRSLKSVCIYS